MDSQTRLDRCVDGRRSSYLFNPFSTQVRVTRQGVSKVEGNSSDTVLPLESEIILNDPGPDPTPLAPWIPHFKFLHGRESRYVHGMGAGSGH